MKNEISSDHFGSLINEKFSPLIDKWKVFINYRYIHVPTTLF
jgi:hypothetical protein